MKRFVLIAVAILALSGFAKANPIGGLILDSTCNGCSPESLTPNAGDVISFTGFVSGLPTNGGATHLGFVDLICTQGNQEVLEIDDQPLDQNSQGFLPVHFTLSWPGMGAADCKAYLYWSRYTDPKRRETNTLTIVPFPVAAQ